MMQFDSTHRVVLINITGRNVRFSYIAQMSINSEKMEKVRILNQQITLPRTRPHFQRVELVELRQKIESWTLGDEHSMSY